ncbi:aminopeptidase N [Nocardioides humilatus]|uniref:Aminopeptidase N n=1 Tax=Nocardioides humilatus TaxID=2607660 RepID=A0A5B1L5G4_9ACTN|nr:aminopeptidase N [Nocardioides humilatus]KAA1415931.1 aminopeptidase N [Nocardioides humilatus]
MATWRSLTRDEAIQRGAQLSITSYDVRLDLTTDDTTFRSITTIRFTSTGGPTFADVRPTALHRAALDGAVLDTGTLDRGRLPLDLSPGNHELVVDATMPFRNDGEGLHRSIDPADGEAYIYGMSFMDAAPTIFACFDQPDLKAPYTMHVTAPDDWLVVGNARAEEIGDDDAAREWRIGPTPRLSTYFVTLVAGPYEHLAEEHDGIRLTMSARASKARALEEQADELFTLTRQSFDELHRLFGSRYAFGDYHQAFVPEFNAGAMENPGCITIRDQLLYDGPSTHADRSYRATLIAHEMAHQWFGNLVTPQWWDDLWLNESFAEYVGYRVIADATAYHDAWVDQSYSRRVWGLTADQRPTTHPVAGNGAVDALAALQDFDGISYARGSNVLRQLAERLGDDVFFTGVRDHFERHRFGNATMHDLFASWTRAGAGDLDGFVDDWLRTPGPDVLTFDRAAGLVRRTPPAAFPADRRHRITVATHGPDGWQREPLELVGPATPYSPPPEAAVLLDADETTWAVAPPDPVTMAALPRLTRTLDPQLRASMWNNVRLGFANATVDPAAVVDLAAVAPPIEDTADSRKHLLPWVLGTVVPLAPAGSLDRVHLGLRAALERTQAGSELRLSTFRALVASCSDAEALASWAADHGIADGVDLDDDLAWRIRRRQARLGLTGKAELDAALDAGPTSHALVEHAAAVASLPTAEGKDFAWSRLMGEVSVAMYEIEAAGYDLWQPGQQHLTQGYAGAYFDQLPTVVAHHQGWVQAVAVEAYFPITHLDDATYARARAALTLDLPAAALRRLREQVDELERRRAVAAAFPASRVSTDPAD